jgi:serine/threonine-protein kinase
MARGPLSPRRAVEIALQVADGLADAHAAGLLHADLRPGTIVMTPKGNAKVYNIGLAAWMSEGPSPYTSPEQRRGEPAGEASDIYALGVILYEMMTAHRPKAGPMTVADARIPADLAPILSRALAESAGDRYQSMATMAAELRTVGAALDARATAAPAPVPPRRAPARRSALRWWLALLALAVVAALLWLAGVRP